MQEITLIIRSISLYSAVPAVLLGIWGLYKGRLEARYRPIIYLVIFSLLADQLGSYAAKAYGNNMPILHMYGLIELLLLGYFFSLIMATAGKVIRLITVLLGVVYVINSLLFEHILTFNPKGHFLYSFVLLLICLYYFYYLYKYEPYEYPHKSGVFWIVVAYLIYLSGAFFSWLLATKSVGIPWVFHNFINATKNILIFVGFWLAIKKDEH